MTSELDIQPMARRFKLIAAVNQESVII